MLTASFQTQLMHTAFKLEQTLFHRFNMEIHTVVLLRRQQTLTLLQTTHPNCQTHTPICIRCVCHHHGSRRRSKKLIADLRHPVASEQTQSLHGHLVAQSVCTSLAARACARTYSLRRLNLYRGICGRKQPMSFRQSDNAIRQIARGVKRVGTSTWHLMR